MAATAILDFRKFEILTVGFLSFFSGHFIVASRTFQWAYAGNL